MNIQSTLDETIAAGKSLIDNPYRLGSTAWAAVIREARRRYQLGELDDIQIEDLQLLESDTGDLIGYEGKTVVLGIPYENFDRPGWFYSFYMDSETVQKIEYEYVTSSEPS
jgi:hypothetical protein